MKRMVDLINADLNGSPDKALIDGAGALKAACKELNLSPRSCFAHIMRLPLTRGGGKVGSKGSLANYLISTMGVKHADAAKIVGDAILANYIPPKDKEDHESFIDLMWERHDERLGTDEKHREHVASTYLSKNPLKLGGRVVGLPGQSGSNNGGEKKGGGIKDRWRRITKRLASDVVKSPVFIVAAIAKDLMMSPDISEFAWKPVRSIHDYDLLRRINKFVLEDKAANLPCDVQYMMVTPYQSHTQLMDPMQTFHS